MFSPSTSVSASVAASVLAETAAALASAAAAAVPAAASNHADMGGTGGGAGDTTGGDSSGVSSSTGSSGLEPASESFLGALGALSAAEGNAVAGGGLAGPPATPTRPSVPSEGLAITWGLSRLAARRRAARSDVGVLLLLVFFSHLKSLPCFPARTWLRARSLVGTI